MDSSCNSTFKRTAYVNIMMEPMAVFERLKTIAMEINVVIHTMMEYMSVYSREYMLLGLLISRFRLFFSGVAQMPTF